MVVNKTFLDTFYLLELLKWNTDEEHPLTQNDLRKIANSQKLNGPKPFINALLLSHPCAIRGMKVKTGLSFTTVLNRIYWKAVPHQVLI